MRSLLLLALLLSGRVVYAGTIPTTVLTPSQTGVSSALLTGSPQALLRVAEYGALTLYIDYTRGAATSVTMSCAGGPTSALFGSVAVATVQSSGAVSMSPASWTWPVTASGVLRAVVAPLNDRFIRCTFTATGANASDRVSVHAQMGAAP